MFVCFAFELCARMSFSASQVCGAQATESENKSDGMNAGSNGSESRLLTRALKHSIVKHKNGGTQHTFITALLFSETTLTSLRQVEALECATTIMMACENEQTMNSHNMAKLVGERGGDKWAHTTYVAEPDAKILNLNVINWPFLFNCCVTTGIWRSTV